MTSQSELVNYHPTSEAERIWFLKLLKTKLTAQEPIADSTLAHAIEILISAIDDTVKTKSGRIKLLPIKRGAKAGNNLNFKRIKDIYRVSEVFKAAEIMDLFHYTEDQVREARRQAREYIDRGGYHGKQLEKAANDFKDLAIRGAEFHIIPMNNIRKKLVIDFASPKFKPHIKKEVFSHRE